jgi:serine/threonine protein kinase
MHRSTSIPQPSFRLGINRKIDNYKLLRCLGHGWEGTAYLAQERGSHAIRVLKFYRLYDDVTSKYLTQVARICESLGQMSVTARYFHSGQWYRQAEKLPYCVFEHLDGIRFEHLLKRKHWARGWGETEAIGTISMLAFKLALAHDQGFALGDFENGNNIILCRNNDPVWCDASFVAEDGKPNRDFREDWRMLLLIVEQLAMRKPRSRQIAKIENWLRSWRTHDFNRRSMELIHSGIYKTSG